MPETSGRPINFVVLGCGQVAPSHAQSNIGLHDIHHVNLVAVCGLIESRAQNFTNTYGATPYTDYLTMFERPDIDVVSVCVPSGLHSQIGQLVAQAGKHVLVEKPLAL